MADQPCGLPPSAPIVTSRPIDRGAAPLVKRQAPSGSPAAVPSGETARRRLPFDYRRVVPISRHPVKSLSDHGPPRTEWGRTADRPEARSTFRTLVQGMNHPIMANPTITRPEWSTVIDPVLQKELEQHVLVTTWDKLLGMVDTVYNWGRRSSLWPLGLRPGLLRDRDDLHGVEPVRHRPVRRRGLPRLAPPGRRDDRLGHRHQDDDADDRPALRPDARAEVRHLDGRLRHRRRAVQGGVQRRLGDRQVPAGRRLHPRLPADAAGPAQRPDHAPEEDRRRDGSSQTRPGIAATSSATCRSRCSAPT